MNQPDQNHSNQRSKAAEAISTRSANYAPPQLTNLGAWQAVTLQLSVPIGPGGRAFWPGFQEEQG